MTGTTSGEWPLDRGHFFATSEPLQIVVTIWLPGLRPQHGDPCAQPGSTTGLIASGPVPRLLNCRSTGVSVVGVFGPSFSHLDAGF